MKRIKNFLKITGVILSLILIIGGLLELPGQYNKFLMELPDLRETWLNSSKWTGMYSSYPEGIVNMEELDLSWESDVKISLRYSEEDHMIQGYIHSETICKSGHLYHAVQLRGAPNILHPNRLDLEAFDYVGGKTVIWDDNLRIERAGLQGAISVTSTGSERRLFQNKLELFLDSELNEEDLDIHCISLDEFRKILEDKN